jgi:hypothetical protein
MHEEKQSFQELRWWKKCVVIPSAARNLLDIIETVLSTACTLINWAGGYSFL